MQWQFDLPSEYGTSSPESYRHFLCRRQQYSPCAPVQLMCQPHLPPSSVHRWQQIPLHHRSHSGYPQPAAPNALADPPLPQKPSVPYRPAEPRPAVRKEFVSSSYLDAIVEKLAFVKYVRKLPKSGFLVLNADDSNCLDLAKESNASIITYGIENQKADFVAKNIRFDEDGFATFDVYYHSEFYETISLSVVGMHNISNALATICLCHSYNISKSAVKTALKKFTGANRRCELLGKFNNSVKVFDDYGHHPTEINATSCAIKQKKFSSSWVVFQPHTYSRTKNLLNEFAESLINFDHIIITDIYAAREINTFGIKESDIVKEIKKYGKEAFYISNYDDIKLYLGEYVKKDDLIITLGAGNITKLSDILVNKK